MHDLPSNMEEFSHRTGGVLGAVDAIIREHTILPFYLPFRSVEDEIDAIASMRGNGLGSLKFRLGILTSRFRANHPLKACVQCMCRDAEEYGVPYWHLDHQYPGVWICTAHQTPLLECTEKSTGVGRFQWVLPSKSVLRQVRLSNEEKCLTELDKTALLSLAESAVQLATLAKGFHFDADTLLRTYHSALSDQGLVTATGSLKISAIAKAFFEEAKQFTSIPELGSLPTTTQEAATQISRLLRYPRSGTHPLRHLVVIHWLFRNWSSFWSAYQSAQHALPHTDQVIDETRPNKMGYETSKRNDLITMIREENISLREAALRIGIDTTTAMAWSASAGIVVSRRPKKLKGKVREAMILDLRCGLDKPEIAKKYDISIQTVTTMLRVEVGLHDAWSRVRRDAMRNAAREKWLGLISSHPSAGIKTLRGMEPASYAWLYRNDRAWLTETNCHIPRSPIGNRNVVKWDQRDLVLAELVKKCALKLSLAFPRKQILLWHLYQELPELKAKLSSLEKMPLTRIAIEQTTRKRQRQQSLNNLF